MRARVDQLLVERGIVESRHQAQAMIMAGEVLVNDQKIDKPGRHIQSDAAIRLVHQRPQFVSRAGKKLDAAIDRFEIELQDAICLDIGASTGGFTDCMLQRGAARVYAVDVGAGQLHWRVRQDARVVVRDRVNARYLDTADVGEPVSFVACDVSFISATRILPQLPRILLPGADAVVLAKPQFEVGKGEVGKGGVVRDAAKHDAVVVKVRNAMIECGLEEVDWMESPILGAGGNREFLLYGTGWTSPSVETR